MRKVCTTLSGGWVKATRSVPAGFSLDAGAATQPRPMGGFGAAKATHEPHGGEWLPRRGTGRGNLKRAVGASFFCFVFF